MAALSLGRHVLFLRTSSACSVNYRTRAGGAGLCHRDLGLISGLLVPRGSCRGSVGVARPASPGQAQGRRRLPALAHHPYVGAGGQADVLATERGELGHAQAGLGHQHQQGVVTPASPGTPVRCCKERVQLLWHQVGDLRPVVALGRDGEDPLDRPAVLGVAQGGVAEQRVDSSQPVVASAGAVVPVAL